jgi:hypothetical protein
MIPKPSYIMILKLDRKEQRRPMRAERCWTNPSTECSTYIPVFGTSPWGRNRWFESIRTPLAALRELGFPAARPQ